MIGINNDIAILKEIQKIDCELSSLEQEKQKKNNDYLKLKESFDSIKIEYDKLQEDQKLTELEIKKFEQSNDELKKRIENSRARMFGVKSQKEFDALKAEIKTNQNTISENENKELELMEKLEKIKEKIPALMQKFEEMNSVLEKQLSEVDTYIKILNPKINELTSKKNELLMQLQPRTKQIYTKILSVKTPALAAIIGTTCSACNVYIPPQTVNEVRKETRIYTCDSCKRILYWQE